MATTTSSKRKPNGRANLRPFDAPYIAILHGLRLKYLTFPGMTTTQFSPVRSERVIRISGLRLVNDGVSHQYSTH